MEKLEEQITVLLAEQLRFLICAEGTQRARHTEDYHKGIILAILVELMLLRARRACRADVVDEQIGAGSRDRR